MTEKREYKIVCKVGLDKYDGFAHIIEQPYNDKYMVWYGLVDIVCELEQAYAMSWQVVPLFLEDGRIGEAKFMSGDLSETHVPHDGKEVGKHLGQFFVGVSSLKVPRS